MAWNKHIGYYLLMMMVASLMGCASLSGKKQGTYQTKAPDSQAIAHTNLAAAYFEQGKYEIALKEFQLAIKYDANYATAYNGLGMVHAKLGELQQADAAFKQAIQLNPKDSAVQNNYGNFLCANGKHIESIPYFLNAVKNPLYQTPQLAYHNAGVCALRGGDKAGAEQHFASALRVSPLMHTAAFQLAKLRYQRGDAIGAKRALQNTLIAQPSPSVLWLGVQIARKLGDKDSEASYGFELRKRFPDSKEAQALVNG